MRYLISVLVLLLAVTMLTGADPNAPNAEFNQVEANNVISGQVVAENQLIVSGTSYMRQILSPTIDDLYARIAELEERLACVESKPKVKNPQC